MRRHSAILGAAALATATFTSTTALAEDAGWTGLRVTIGTAAAARLRDHRHDVERHVVYSEPQPFGYYANPNYVPGGPRPFVRVSPQHHSHVPQYKASTSLFGGYKMNQPRQPFRSNDRN